LVQIFSNGIASLPGPEKLCLLDMGSTAGSFAAGKDCCSTGCGLHEPEPEIFDSADAIRKPFLPDTTASPDDVRLPRAAESAGNCFGSSSNGNDDTSPDHRSKRITDRVDEQQVVDRRHPNIVAGNYSSNYFDWEASELETLGDSTASSADVTRRYMKHIFHSGATYEGQWLGCMRDGFGTQRWPDGAMYQGEWQRDCAAGKGLFKHNSGDTYAGQWLDNVAHGIGVFRHRSGETIYCGEFKDDLEDGHGVETWAEQAHFEGQFKKGKKHGFGKYRWEDGSVYCGTWFCNQIEGKGDYLGHDNRHFKGEWRASMMHGRGQCIWPDGRLYEGQYEDDQKHGFGIFHWVDGQRYFGYWKSGKRHGLGLLAVAEPSSTNRSVTHETELTRWDNGNRIQLKDTDEQYG